MHLSHLVLRDFRNASQIDIIPDPGFNIFWGENAQGKTNLLESIYLLATLKSFRGARNEDLIRQGTSRARIQAEAVCGGVVRSLQLTIASEGKQPRVDGKTVTTAANFFGHLRPVVFAPEEVALVRGAPAGRRSLLDRAIFQADPSYLGRAQEYARVLRQRNRLLKDQRPKDEVAPWTAKLIEAGAAIRGERQAYLTRLVPHFREAYQHICGGREWAELSYPEGLEQSADREAALARSLAAQRESEQRAGTTLSGPHRDDPQFLLDGRSIRPFASQGQQRSLMLAFKTAQIIDLEQRMGEAPVLLLDDLTGELDRRRQEFFFRFLLERRSQVFLTTTDLQPLLNEGFSRARRFRVRGGTLDPEENATRPK